MRLSQHCCVCVCVHLPVFPDRGSKSQALRLLPGGFLSGCPLSRALFRAEGRFATLRAAAVCWNEFVVARSPGQEPQSGRPLHSPLLPGLPRQSGGSRIPPASTEVLLQTSSRPACPAAESEFRGRARGNAGLLRFWIVLSLCCHVLLLFCMGVSLRMVGRWKRVTFPSMVAAAAVFSVAGEEKNMYVCRDTVAVCRRYKYIYIYICTHIHTQTEDVDRSGGHCRGCSWGAFGGDTASLWPECDNCHTSKVIMTTRGATKGWICVGYKKEGRGKTRWRGCTALPPRGTFSPPPFLASPLFSPRPRLPFLSFVPPSSSLFVRILGTFFI